MRGVLRPLWFGILGLLAVVPGLALVVQSAAGAWFFPALVPGELRGDAWHDLLSGGRLADALGTSLVLAVLTGAVSAAVGLPVGRAMAELRGWRRALAAGGAFLPVAIPPIALATGLQLAVLSAGAGGTLVGVLAAHLVPAAAYAALYYLGVFAVYDRRIEDEARALGATPLQTWHTVTIPLLRRPIAEAAALGFLVSWAQLPLTLVIGGGRVRTLAVEVLVYAQSGQDRYAAAGALLLVIPALLVLAAASLGVRRTEAVAA